MTPEIKFGNLSASHLIEAFSTARQLPYAALSRRELSRPNYQVF